jgi:hypothetical protein
LTSIRPHAAAAAAAAAAVRCRAGSGTCASYCSTCGRRPKRRSARVRRPAQPRRGGVRPGPGQHRGGGPDPPCCRQRPGFGPGTGHADPVHRRRRPPRRLRPAYLAGRAGPGKPLCSHALAEWRWNCASYLMMRPPSAHSTWPVIAAAASEAK